MAIYFIRHGIDEEGFRGGWSQRGLVVEGYRQAERLGYYLKENQSSFNITRILCSDLQRALDTANEIARELNLPVESSQYWRETNNGVIAGMPHEIANERYPGLYFSALRMDERFPGGESPQEFFTRISSSFSKLCNELESTDPNENVIMVTHGGVINVIYHILKGLTWTNKNAHFPASYTSIHKIEYQADKWAVTAENLTEHISRDQATGMAN
ncbi:phosphoglycerate mutase [Paenibacillus odorifer]|uniref:histidine phosphatase family protein n=1 Tax=Paenibacillus TaxID=44249 RepID=UPI00096F2BFB|nr:MULTISPECIES: histidine phosphatase family protein [Paenibacillus]MDH6426509.1 putative phosphoglycerate mutase [Paenibacillus sp. PastH-4]MDH6442533.1 putative phosphoglycerate mutase [Paenibacillus sp. PastF-4]MDH6526755.1 putative phosphoglycerate mutase [Paenibacillus sp. PastH-3]OMD69374.1 phosphoglycerate mutase [Paenibacillus odorifer]